MNCPNCDEITSSCPCDNCGFNICKNDWGDEHND